MIWPGIDTILENVHSPLNSTKKSRRKRLHFEDDDNGGDQDKEIRDIEDSFAEININGIENDNDMESRNATFSCVIFLCYLMGNAHFQVWCQYQAISYAKL
jgi:hypothetical protein